MKHASANYAKGNIYISSSSLSVDGVWLISPPYFKFGKEVDIEQLGEAILAALNGSKQNVPHPEEFSNIGKDFLKAVGLKSFKEIQGKDAKSCGLNLKDNLIEIQPHQNAGNNKGFVVLKSDPMMPIVIPADASKEQIGSALLQGFEHAKIQ